MRRLDPKYKRTMRWDECFSRLPKGPALMAEIGVWRAGTSERLLAAHHDLRMILVDPWKQAEPGSSYATSGSINANTEHESAYVYATLRLKRFADRITVHRMASTDAAPQVEDASLDLVFLDGDHSYEGVSTDIDAWRSKVRQGGWIGGHDFGEKKHRFPGVERAVRERFERFELGGDSTWWVRL